MTGPARRPPARTVATERPIAGWDAADEPDAERARYLWKSLARARKSAVPGAVSAAEDAVFRLYLPMARSLAARTTAGSVVGTTPEQVAELGLAQAVLAWRKPDGDGFANVARRCINGRLGGLTAEAIVRRGPLGGNLPRQHVRPTGALPSPDERTNDVEVAMLDRCGVIVSVNDAWRAFSAANGGNSSRTGVGVSYLSVCDAAVGDPYADQVAAAIRQAAAGALPGPLSVLVPCHSPTRNRWYDVLVSPRWNKRFRPVGVAVTVSLRHSSAI
ncbi:hypothetical protein ACVBEQ_06080 [Nakamurella sp. GG22]